MTSKPMRSGYFFFFLLLVKSTDPSHGFCTPIRGDVRHKHGFSRQQSFHLFSQKKNKNKNESPQNQPDNNKTIPKREISEEEASQKLFYRLNWISRLDAISTVAAIAFLLIGVVLRVFGYSYVVDDNGFRIDTLEARQFRDEVRRNSRFQD